MCPRVSADPRIVPEARKLSRVSFEEMLEIAPPGAGVLNLGRWSSPVTTACPCMYVEFHLGARTGSSRRMKHGAGIVTAVTTT